jgi:hypothetical protein
MLFLRELFRTRRRGGKARGEEEREDGKVRRWEDGREYKFVLRLYFITIVALPYANFIPGKTFREKDFKTGRKNVKEETKSAG